jgi:hypothetical protein
MNKEKTKFLSIDPHFHPNGGSGNEKKRRNIFRCMLLKNDKLGIDVVVRADHQDRQLVDPFSEQEENWRARHGIKTVIAPGVEMATNGGLSTTSISVPKKPTIKQPEHGVAHWLVMGNEPSHINEFITELKTSADYPTPKEMLDILFASELYMIVAHPNPDLSGLKYQKENYSAHLWLIAAAQEYLDGLLKRGQKNPLLGLEVMSGYQSKKEIDLEDPISTARDIFAELNGLLKFGGSDAHDVDGVGQAITAVGYNGKKPADIKELFKLLRGEGEYERRFVGPMAGSSKPGKHNGREKIEQIFTNAKMNLLAHL